MSDVESLRSRGMARQLEQRDAAEASGAVLRGWKVAFPTAAAQAAAGVDRPVLAWISDRSEWADGASVDVAGWTRPTAEAELAIHLGSDVPAGGSVEDAGRAIAAVSVAIEIVDVNRGFDALEDVIAEGLFHRGYVLGVADEARAGGDASGLTVTGALDGNAYNTTSDPTSVVGALPVVARFVADELAAHGASLRAGDVILAGSVVPGQPFAAGQTLTVDAGPLGTLGLRFAG